MSGISHSISSGNKGSSSGGGSHSSSCDCSSQDCGDSNSGSIITTIFTVVLLHNYPYYFARLD